MSNDFVEVERSTPSVFEFSPDLDWQRRLVDDVLCNYDYSLGTHVALCSGSVGSGKSLPAAHLGVRHCLENKGARLLLARKALPDLKDTIFKKVLEHLDCDELVRERDYWVREDRAHIRFRNGSEIISRSWSDRKYKKLGSLELSAAIIEEMSENDAEDEKAWDYIKTRVGRLPHIRNSWILGLTNPDEPDHFVYKRLIQKTSPTIHVYYSKLSDNKFLGPEYEESLREDMDPLLARRLLDGEWISIAGKGIYHAYSEKNFVNKKYEVNPYYPVLISWDFNIAEGKPLSLVLAQYVNGVFHFFDEIVIEGMRTSESCDELAERGLLRSDWHYEIFGDSTGRHKDTRNNLSDWDIVKKFFDNYLDANGQPLRWEFKVPRSNVQVRKRHNVVNAHCLNANGNIRLLIYDSCPVADQGMRLTKLKTNGTYVEDDSKAYQHITTAMGYMIYTKTRPEDEAPQFL